VLLLVAKIRLPQIEVSGNIKELRTKLHNYSLPVNPPAK
jgi:hypothetical protein